MRTTYKRLILSALLILLLVLSACNMPSQPTPAPTDAGLVRTLAAYTVIAQITQAAAGQGFTLVAPTATLPAIIIIPTNTLPPAAPTNTLPPAIPIDTLAPTNTPVPPSSTPVPIPCDRASFVEDVNYPDNTEVSAGTSFVKTWRLKNTGSCTWNSSYSVLFESGDAMSAPASVQLTTGTVAPGQMIDVSITFKAPDTAKTYQGFWKLRNGGGVIFGIGNDGQSAFWVKVKVVNPVTPTPSATLKFDFVAKGPDAEWHNATTLLSWGDPNEDNPGVAVNLASAKLEDNKTYNKLLAMYPQVITDGVIYGIYPNYTVQSGDHFRTGIGFRPSCTGAKVRFQFKIREGGSDTVVGEWIKNCDNAILMIDKDLSAWDGKTVQVILTVSTEGSPDNDKLLLIQPRIEK